MTETKTGICGLCGGNCLVDVHMTDGKITYVEGNDSLPYSNGKLCVKGAALKQQIYSPERLHYPMRRIGARGEGLFERISWEEALDAVADKMASVKDIYGADQTMFYVGHPKWFRPHFQEFAAKYGTANLGTESSTCAYALKMATACTYGESGFPRPDFKNCKTLVVWGVNSFYSQPPAMVSAYLQAVEHCKNVIVVDPRCTPTTELATLHLRPVPGTDGALALGICHVLIYENLYNKEYVEKYSHGFEEFKEYVKAFTPEYASEITGVPAEDIRKAAHLLTEDFPSTLQMSASPVVHNINGFQNSRAILSIFILTGSYGVTGGVCAPGRAPASLKGSFMVNAGGMKIDPTGGLSHAEFPAWTELVEETQVSHIADYLDGKGAYPIRMLLAFGMNHRMWPRPDLIEQAMKNEALELIVSVDAFMTETSIFADILLPIALPLEKEQIYIAGPNLVRYQPQILSDSGELKNDMEIILELAKRLNIELYSPVLHNYEDYMRMQLEPTGLTLEEVKAAPEGLPSKQSVRERTSEQILSSIHTPSGKLEFISEVMRKYESAGCEPLPIYHDFREQLPMDEYPLILATGSRKPQLFHSRTYRLPWLTNLEPYPVIDIHPDDAQTLDIADGEEVILKTPIGQMELTIHYTSSSLQGMVNVYHGAGEKDINLLLDDNYLDPVTGFPGYKSYCCRIEKKEVH